MIQLQANLSNKCKNRVPNQSIYNFYMSHEGCCKYKENVELQKLTKRFVQINCIVLLRVCSLHKLNFTGHWPKISIGVYQAENVPRFQIKFIRIRFVFVFGIRWKCPLGALYLISIKLFLILISKLVTLTPETARTLNMFIRLRVMLLRAI